MKNKLLVIGSLSLAVSSVVNAAVPNDVVFIGSVSTATCDVELQVDGAVSQTINLGSLAVSSTGSAKPFSIVAKDASASGCASLASSGTATVAWTGNFTSTGLSNQKSGAGAASDATVVITAVNSKTANTVINNATKNVDFTADKTKTGLNFTAALKSGTTTGLFESATTFVVAYK